MTQHIQNYVCTYNTPCEGILPYTKPFPTYNKSAADDFENLHAKTRKISINEGIIKENSEIACFEQFPILSQCFQKSIVAETSKCVYR